MRGQVLEALASEGILLEPDAAEFVLEKQDPVSFTRQALSTMEQKPLIVTLRDLTDGADLAGEETQEEMAEEFPEPSAPRARGEVKVLRDVTGISCCEGNINDFAQYFSDRFRTIKRMLSNRRELAGSVPISKALKVSRDVRLIGLVNEAHATKNGHVMLELEDEEDRIKVLIPKSSEFINDSVVNDEVIGVVGNAAQKGDLVVAEEIIRPDVPLRKAMQPSDSSSAVAFMSDIHLGSNTFLERQWARMMEWLSQEWERQGINYLVIPGDIVDGIGIFPGQEEELVIDDVFKQYEDLAERLKEVPDGIQMVVQPGNHDAVRPAEPQPTFSKKITDLFDSSIMFVGNPCYLEIEERVILSYHGRSMDDLIAGIQSLSYEKPIQAMEEMLRRRHLAPIYGGKTPIAPEKEDFLTIDRIPDIFVTGHVHGAGVTDYRGVRLINASTWQAQTAYQRMHNFNPDPAKLPIVHLGNGRCVMKDFN
ncbi:MAG: DNA-directed DNA polymerase II small subunit [Methanomassiliicoccales archaeon]